MFCLSLLVLCTSQTNWDRIMGPFIRATSNSICKIYNGCIVCIVCIVLQLPAYNSLVQLQQKLLLAIEDCTTYELQ